MSVQLCDRCGAVTIDAELCMCAAAAANASSARPGPARPAGPSPAASPRGRHGDEPSTARYLPFGTRRFRAA